MCTSACFYYAMYVLTVEPTLAPERGVMDRIMRWAAEQHAAVGWREMKSIDEVVADNSLPPRVTALPVSLHCLPTQPDASFGNVLHVGDVPALLCLAARDGPCVLLLTARQHTIALAAAGGSVGVFDPLVAEVELSDRADAFAAHLERKSGRDASGSVLSRTLSEAHLEGLLRRLQQRRYVTRSARSYLQ